MNEGMNSTSDFFDRVVSGLYEVQSNAASGLSDADRIELLRGAGDVFRRVEALIVETISSTDPEFAARFGCRSTNELAQRALRTDAAGAARVVTASKIVRREA